MCFVYILYSPGLDCFYIGSSEDPDKRLTKHLAKHSGFTSKAKDWQISYREQFENKTDALRRERQLKDWKNKTRIKELILKARFS